MAAIRLAKLPDDWKAEWLREVDTTVNHLDGSNAAHRVQTIRVRKGDAIYEEVTDLGLASLYKHEPLYIMAGGLTPVGRVREMAARIRGEATLGQRYGLEVPDFKRLWEQYVEERWASAHHRSVSGPTLTRVRS